MVRKRDKLLRGAVHLVRLDERRGRPTGEPLDYHQPLGDRPPEVVRRVEGEQLFDVGERALWLSERVGVELDDARQEPAAGRVVGRRLAGDRLLEHPHHVARAVRLQVERLEAAARVVVGRVEARFHLLEEP